MSGGEGDDFIQRRRAAVSALDQIDKSGDAPSRPAFFDAVYERAAGDEAAIPWADLAPKPQLLQWLQRNPGISNETTSTAIDIACGLGDNAEALARAGYATTAFDLAEKAIHWAKRRFPETSVDYRVADLFNPPEAWIGGFDLVHECYTLQALPPQSVGQTAAAIASLVAPGGTLLVYTRINESGAPADGPPWPLREQDALLFRSLGLTLVSKDRFVIERHGRSVPHWFCEWKKPQ